MDISVCHVENLNRLNKTYTDTDVMEFVFFHNAGKKENTKLWTSNNSKFPPLPNNTRRLQRRRNNTWDYFRL